MKTILSILILSTTLIVHAQPNRFKEKREQIQSLKTAYISSALHLTPEESAKFWPLYNAFEEKQHDTKQDNLRHYLENNENNLDELTAKDAAALLIKMENNEDMMYQDRKKFVQSLKEFLPAIKILKLKNAEEEFKRKLLQQYRNRKDH